MRIALAVAVGAANACPRVSDRDLLVQIVGVTNEAPAVVGGRCLRRLWGFFVIEQQQGLVIEKQQRLTDGRLRCTLILLATANDKKDAEQHKCAETMSQAKGLLGEEMKHPCLPDWLDAYRREKVRHTASS
jgi:hypothetical protein